MQAVLKKSQLHLGFLAFTGMRIMMPKTKWTQRRKSLGGSRKVSAVLGAESVMTEDCYAEVFSEHLNILA